MLDANSPPEQFKFSSNLLSFNANFILAGEGHTLSLHMSMPKRDVQCEEMRAAILLFIFTELNV